MHVLNLSLLVTELEVSISPLGYEVNESEGSVEVTIQKSGAFPTTITGTLTTSPGTAGEFEKKLRKERGYINHYIYTWLCLCDYIYIIVAVSSDFTGGTYSYTIPANEQQTTVSIPILDDNIVEQLREQFSISLSVQPQPGLNLGNSQTSVTIVDDDSMILQ